MLKSYENLGLGEVSSKVGELFSVFTPSAHKIDFGIFVVKYR